MKSWSVAGPGIKDKATKPASPHHRTWVPLSQILAWTTTLRVGRRRRKRLLHSVGKTFLGRRRRKRLLHERVPEHLEERGPLPECADDEGSQRLRGQGIHEDCTCGLQT